MYEKPQSSERSLRRITKTLCRDGLVVVPCGDAMVEIVEVLLRIADLYELDLQSRGINTAKSLNNHGDMPLD